MCLSFYGAFQADVVAGFDQHVRDFKPVTEVHKKAAKGGKPFTEWGVLFISLPSPHVRSMGCTRGEGS